MRARLIVFPMRGRNWCFCRSIDSAVVSDSSSQTRSNFKDLWERFSSSKSNNVNAKLELIIDYVADKMSRGWTALEKAPDGTVRNKIHGVGLKLLSRVKPSEIFLKSITKEVSSVEITYPPSLNARLVHRRLRHVALRGTVIHKKYFYGSVSLLPVTATLAVLPLPNVVFFWCLFRTYSHWRALQGSEKLLQLVSDSNIPVSEKKIEHENSEQEICSPLCSSTWVLRPSKELEEFLNRDDKEEGPSNCLISLICKTFNLNKNDVLKYRDSG